MKYSESELKGINSPIVNDGKFALTTIDNPYNPFTQFKDWLIFDEQKGYCTICYLGRIANISDGLSENENNDEIENAIDEIIKYDFMHIYKKVLNPNYKSINI